MALLLQDPVKRGAMGAAGCRLISGWTVEQEGGIIVSASTKTR